MFVSLEGSITEQHTLRRQTVPVFLRDMTGDGENVVEIRHIDPSIESKAHKYSGLLVGTKVLVTAGGPVADATVSRFISAGCEVTVLGSTQSSATLSSTPGGLTIIEGSILSREACAKAAKGQDLIVHTARATVAAHADEVTANLHIARELVDGTRNLLDAATAADVKYFVFLSSASAIFGGDDLIASSDEIPYPRRHVDLLSAAIAKTEKAVLDANVNRTVDAATKTGLSTCSIRAATVYGPRDQIFLPGLAYRARSGASFIGDGNNMVDFVFAGNVAHALVLTAQQLLSNQSAAADNKSDGDPAGRALFITDAEPVPFGDFARRVLSGLGYPASAKGLSVQYAVVLAVLLRLLSILISSFVAFQPAVTAQRVAEESRTRRFDVSGAKKVLGYAPLWSQEEGLAITLQASQSLRNPKAKLKYVGPFIPEEVAKHCTGDDAWIIVDSKVYDVTPYLDQHPGGESMLRNAGGDASKGFRGPQHPPQAKEILDRHYIGDLKCD